MPEVQIDRFRVLAKLGETDLSSVFKAEDVELGRTVALKVLRRPPGGSERDRSLLRREAQAISRIDHPNVVTLFEMIEHEGQDYLVMQYVDGPTLRSEIAAGPLPLARALRVACEVAEALEAAHRLGVVHRDLKPENILLTASGTAKVLDFGLAHVAGFSSLRGAGAMVGTLPYMAPEQVRGDPVDARTDVYSLGAVLYEIVCGRPPHDTNDYGALMNRIMNSDATPLRQVRPELPEDLERVVAQALRRKPEDRYASASAFLHDLRLLRARYPEPSHEQKLLARPRRRPGWPHLVAGGLIALSAVGWWLVAHRSPGAGPRGPRVLIAHWEANVRDERGDWLPSGVMDCMIRALGAREGLCVISRETARATFDATARDERLQGSARVLAAARRLRARYLVSGTIEPAGSDLLIGCDLTDVGSGTLVRTWSRRIAGLDEELYAAIDALALGIVETIGVPRARASGVREALAAELTPSMDALRFYHVGLQRAETGDDPGACEALRLAVARDSAFVDAQLLLAQLTPGEAERARAVAAALAARGRATPATRALVEAADFKLHGRWQEAEWQYRAAIDLDPENVKAAQALADLHMRRHRFEEAVAGFAALHEVSPDDHSFTWTWCVAYLEIRRPARALAVVGEWRRDFPEAEAPLRALIETRYLLGQYAEALALCDTLERLRPGAATTQRAYVFSDLGRLREARRLYETLASAPDAYLAPARSSSYLALQSYEEGRYAEGLRMLEPALRDEPGSYNDWLGGILSVGAGDLARARRHAENIGRRLDTTADSTLDEAYGDRRTYYHLLGNIALAAGDTAGAVRLHELAVKFTGRLDGRYLRVELGRTRLAAGDVAGAAREFEQVLSVQSNYPLALLGLGRARLALGDRAAARAPLATLRQLWRDADADFPPGLELTQLLDDVRAPRPRAGN